MGFTINSFDPCVFNTNDMWMYDLKTLATLKTAAY